MLHLHGVGKLSGGVGNSAANIVSSNAFLILAALRAKRDLLVIDILCRKLGVTDHEENGLCLSDRFVLLSGNVSDTLADD